MFAALPFRLPLVLILSALGAAAADAQGTPPGPPRSADPVPCSRAATAELRDAIAAAQALFDAAWQTTGAARVTHFKTRPEAINPFAPREPKAEPPAPAIEGFIHAASVGCAYFAHDTETAVWFVGTAVRFHETGGWSGVLPQGLLMGARVRRIDGAAKAIVDPAAPTVVLPDAVLSKPDASDVPPLTAPATGKARKR